MRNDIHEDCYFYFADHDMNATISNCTYKDYAYGECPCKGCQHILPKHKVREIVLNYIDLHPDILEADREAESRTPQKAALPFSDEDIKAALLKSIVGGGRNNRV